MQSRQAGFTLIEILVVLALLGILMGIAVFNYQGARKSVLAKEAQQFGSNVLVTINGYITAHPGVSAQDVIGGSFDCSQGGTINQGTDGVTLNPGGADTAMGRSWSKAADHIHCTLSPDSAINEYAIKVETWSDARPDTHFINGQAP